ncbi:hypothetical protein [Amycolatopsis australiensis]|uniref:Uncharacterized protein n=1 Tax=Amycolatopsis australiensis TaxID=546364 RepID=A0A1K1SRL9_9PSEU|nr:hypothetical protein [Amycolatopsis australiensis]SFW86946.1 hypothetical protein SAMN04489730_6543 [Amycolatopsis australiensis]
MSTELADLAGALADRAESTLAATSLSDHRVSAPAGSVTRDVVEDLRTIARYLKTTDLLLQPADDDLSALAPQPDSEEHREYREASWWSPAHAG